MSSRHRRAIIPSGCSRPSGSKCCEPDARSRFRVASHCAVRTIAVPGDFSSAAFFLVAGCLAAADGLTLCNVGVNPTRTGLLDLLRADGRGHPLCTLRQCGAGAEPVADIEVRASRLKGIRVPESAVPLSIDEFPVLFIAAAVRGRATRWCAERSSCGSRKVIGSRPWPQGLERLGVENELSTDGLWIRGGDGFGGGCIESHGDHRIAMAFAVASLRARGADRDPRRRQCRDLVSGFPGDGPRSWPASDRRVCMTDAPPRRSSPSTARAAPGKARSAARWPAQLGWHLLDSGALYRLVALAGLELGGSRPVISRATRGWPATCR